MAGTWCGGAGDVTGAGGAGSSGSCFDCYYAQTNSQWAQQHSPNDLSAAKTHCTSNDSFPNSCDFVLRSLEQATGCSLFIIIFVALLVPLPIINDADEVGTDNKILVHRLQLMKNTPRRQACLYAIAWWVLVTRKWLLPAVLVGAAVAQVNLVLPVLFRFTHTCALCDRL